MAQIIKVKGTEAAIASASNVGFATLVRVLNNKAGTQLITKKNAAGAVLATVTMAGNEVLYIKKAPSETLTGISTTLAVSVAQ